MRLYFLQKLNQGGDFYPQFMDENHIKSATGYKVPRVERAKIAAPVGKFSHNNFPFNSYTFFQDKSIIKVHVFF